ncbi:chloride channel protein [Acidithiobacillus ferriphilus]|uniref:chloride channel protein n=1 Tax=Acidithiobacillus ferriphilus TaxID=1689834 RepID=UPI001D03366E|nr:chloride channel protein [Acidithiobacillus ferriphilus]
MLPEQACPSNAESKIPLLLLLKILTFPVTLGSGGSGGVFSPVLYVAAMLTEARGRL